MKPRLSVILPALLGYDTVLAAIDSWEAQSCRDELEVLILCPTAEEAKSLAPGQIVIATGSLLLHQARALAIRRAKADYVLLAEDHCLPDRFCAQAVLDRLAEGWDVVGPALRSGNPQTYVTQASFLLGYGQWMNPASGPTHVLPGHNSALRKDPLMALGSDLEEELIVGAFLLRRLRDQGHRFYLENQATMRHFDVPNWSRSMRIFRCVGLCFGAMRARRWPLAARVLYPLAAPAVAARHWWRTLTQYRRAGSQAGLSPFCLAATFVLALAWAWGEPLGALMGVIRVAPGAAFSELKPVARSQV